MKWIHRFTLFLFDFDGLLVNTECLHYQAYVNMLAKRGFALDWSFAQYSIVAQRNASALREALYVQFPDLDPNWDLVYSEKKRCYLELIASGRVELMPGVEKLLLALQEAKIRRVVATHSPLEQIQMIRGLLPILQTIPYWVTREDYEKPKPSPDAYLRAIELYGEMGDKIVGFEDSLKGYEALSQTPALPILICESHHPQVELALHSGRGLHFESFNKIPDF